MFNSLYGKITAKLPQTIYLENPTKEQMKEEYGEQIKLLKKGVSVRQVAKLTSTSPTTIQKLKKEFC